MSYNKLVAHWRQIILLQRAITTLAGDQSTTMPAGAGRQRAEVIANLQVLKHGLVTNPVQVPWFKVAAAEPLNEWQAYQTFFGIAHMGE